MAKKVLVTGGAGFVGRRLIKSLLDKNYNVVAVDSIASLTGGIDPDKSWPHIVLKTIKILPFIKQIVENGL